MVDMKIQTQKKRNSLAVRLIDKDHENFLETTGKNYSETLRALINLYSQHFQPEDANLPVTERILAVMKRI